MLLYFTTPRDSLVDKGQVVTCPLRVCRTEGFTAPHLCFATEPIAGQGQYVHSVDIPETEVTPYEYQNDFRRERARFFAIPHALLAKYEARRETYESRTGTPWNRWVVPVLDRRPTGRGHSLGSWALVWMSRDGIAGARVERKREGQAHQAQYLSIEVTATSEFDPERDYIVVEIHEESERQVGQGTKETWRLETVAGVTPRWAIFPTAWQNWVWDERVTNSAVRYLLTIAPHLQADVNYAMQKDSKHNKARAWRNVADEVARVVSRKLNTRVDLGKLAGHSWTAVAAMPHRIAMRLSQNLPDTPWVPPRPKPEYENPEESGRILLANLYGAYPKRGPGVDHAPQDRPYTGREGELNTNESFDVRRAVSVGFPASASPDGLPVARQG
jgi:hypothetical protein